MEAVACGGGSIEIGNDANASFQNGNLSNETMRSWMSNGLSEAWSDARRFRWVLIALMLLALAARAQSITGPMYSIDGYIGGDPASYRLFLANGRWGLVALLWLRAKLGYVGMDVTPSALILSIGLFAGAGFLYARVLLGKLSASEFLIFAALFTLHPFNTEFYTFSDATLDIALSAFLAAAGRACAGASARSGLGAATGGLLVLVALSIYQLAIAHVVVVSLLTIVERMTRPDSAQRERGLRPLFVTAPARALAIAIAAAIVFLLTMLITPYVFGVALSERADLSGVPDIGAKIATLATAVRLAFRPIPGLIPSAVSTLLIGILAFSAVAILVSILFRRGWAMMLAGGALIAAAMLCSVGIPAASKVTWLVPRVLSPFSIFAAGVTVLGWRCMRPSWARCAVGVALAALLVAYVGASNRILYDQRRVNLWDMQQANRVLARLELDPHFHDMRALAFVNGDWGRTTQLPTVVGDLNISAFNAPLPSKLGLMAQATGSTFAPPSEIELQTAARYCASAGAWPAGDSVVIANGLGIVCLPPPR